MTFLGTGPDLCNILDETFESSDEKTTLRLALDRLCVLCHSETPGHRRLEARLYLHLVVEVRVLVPLPVCPVAWPS